MIRKRRLLAVLLFVTGCMVAFAQTRSITGVVTDSEGVPMPGVNVVIVGTTTGTITDASGVYTINASAGDQLQFRFVGMAEQTITVGEQTTINVTLQLEATQMDEVVVVGYGVQKKESVVAAISQASGEEIARTIGGTDMANGLTGLMPGVITIKTSGIPGGSGEDDAGTEIYIRGRTTWNGGQPLILVDGVERFTTDNGGIRPLDIDPSEVESISVLKDAAATAVFGVKGANGVILITTKRGKIGKPTLSFESIFSASTISKIPPVLGSYQGNYLKNLAIEHELPVDPNSWNDYVPEEILGYYRDQTYPELYPDVDWTDEFTNDYAFSQKYNMNVSGGTQFVKYFVSLGYQHEGDILATQDFGQGYDPDFQYDRYNFRSNLDFDLTKTTRFSVNLAGYYGKQQRPAGDKWNFWKGLYGRPPDLYPVQYSDGTFADYEGFDRFENSVSRLNFGGLENENRSEVNTDFMLTQDLGFITKGLSAGVKVSYDNRFNTLGPDIDDDGVLEMYIDPDILYAQTAGDSTKNIILKYPGDYANQSHGYNFVDIPNSRNSERSQTNIYRALYYEIKLNYARDFGKHGVSVLGLFNRRESVTGSNFSNFREDWVGRLTYNFDKRYFLEVNGAYNGSEKFGGKSQVEAGVAEQSYRFGFFPSVAVGWTLSNETFFKNTLPFVNLAKLRYTWGQVGNDQGIDRWQYVGGWTLTNEYAIFGSPYTNSAYPIYLEDRVPNPEIRWETAEKNNVGLETAFFKNLIQVNFDYFWEHRYDMFISQSQRLTNVIVGKDLPAANIGELKSKGWELEVKFSKATANQFRVTATLHWARARDEVLYREDPELREDYRKQAGFPIGQTKVILNQDGFINSWDDMYTGVMGEDNTQRLPGDFRQVDFNSDGVINDKDSAPWGYPSRPEYNYGLWLGLEYKGFSISGQLYGVYNVTDGESYGEFHENYTITRQWHWDTSWSPEFGRTGGDATMPHVRYNSGSPYGEYWQWDRSYLKIQTAEISYTLNSNWLKQAGISHLRIFISGNNLFTWSDLPEDRDADASTQRSYPLMRRFNLGLNVTF